MYRSQNRGIMAGILAGVFWGTPFLVPMVLANFSGLEITFGRFFFFGLISFIVIAEINSCDAKFDYPRNATDNYSKCNWVLVV